MLYHFTCSTEILKLYKDNKILAYREFPFSSLSISMFNTFLGVKHLLPWHMCAQVVNQYNSTGVRAEHCWCSLIYCTVNGVSSCQYPRVFLCLNIHWTTELREKHDKGSYFLTYLYWQLFSHTNNSNIRYLLGMKGGRTWRLPLHLSLDIVFGIKMTLFGSYFVISTSEEKGKVKTPKLQLSLVHKLY